MKFTREQLLEAFNKVQNKDHWKNPIDSFCSKDEIEIVTEAIIYFTATEPTFKAVGINKLQVTAPGYYLGPAN